MPEIAVKLRSIRETAARKTVSATVAGSDVEAIIAEAKANATMSSPLARGLSVAVNPS